MLQTAIRSPWPHLCSSEQEQPHPAPWNDSQSCPIIKYRTATVRESAWACCPTKGHEDVPVAHALLRAAPRLISASGGHRHKCRCSTQECVRHAASSTESVPFGANPSRGTWLGSDSSE